LALFAQLAHSATVNGVRVWRAPDHTRIVLDLDAPVQHSLTLANNPDRIILDVPASKLTAGLAKLPLADTPVTAIRSYVQNKNDLRLVLDLKAKIAPNSFLLKAHGGMHDRLVIDLYDEPPLPNPASAPAATTPAPVAKNPATAVPSTTVPSTPAPSTTVPSATGTAKPAAGNSATTKPPVPVAVDLQGQRRIIIAVDAGHGGEDPGAMGPNRLREKEVTLS